MPLRFLLLPLLFRVAAAPDATRPGEGPEQELDSPAHAQLWIIEPSTAAAGIIDEVGHQVIEPAKLMPFYLIPWAYSFKAVATVAKQLMALAFIGLALNTYCRDAQDIWVLANLGELSALQKALAILVRLAGIIRRRQIRLLKDPADFDGEELEQHAQRSVPTCCRLCSPNICSVVPPVFLRLRASEIQALRRLNVPGQADAYEGGAALLPGDAGEEVASGTQRLNVPGQADADEQGAALMPGDAGEEVAVAAADLSGVRLCVVSATISGVSWVWVLQLCAIGLFYFSLNPTPAGAADALERLANERHIDDYTDTLITTGVSSVSDASGYVALLWALL